MEGSKLMHLYLNKLISRGQEDSLTQKSLMGCKNEADVENNEGNFKKEVEALTFSLRSDFR